MRSTIFQRGEPSASAPSRSSLGTSRSVSSVARVMIGHMSTVSAMAPAHAEKECMAMTTTAQMKAPATIEGVDSRISATNRTTAARRPRPYSDR